MTISISKPHSPSQAHPSCRALGKGYQASSMGKLRHKGGQCHALGRAVSEEHSVGAAACPGLLAPVTTLPSPLESGTC